ncbi:hypothetical protein ZWY2020_012387 [Hordeum vulgare]|nr:hypothetical protein ZWY2020_012387 [Hordeum vulgare]
MGSCLPWGSSSLIPFLLLQFMLHLSSGCFVEERDALLDIQSSLIRAGSPGTLDSWRKDGGDCCSWERVKCNNSTKRVSHLDLSYASFTTSVDDRWNLNLMLFSAFHELECIDLSYNYPCSLSLEGLVRLSKLRYLDLSDTTRGGGFPEIIGRIISLEVLALNYNNLNGSLPAQGQFHLKSQVSVLIAKTELHRLELLKTSGS